MAYITGTDSADNLDGSADTSDDLYGKDGNDTYRFDRYSGFDDIVDTGGFDTIQFDGSVFRGDLRLDT